MEEKTVKTAMLGGTFDPIHLGHLFLLNAAIKGTDYKRFLIVPANINNFKQNAKPFATDRQRLEMARLAIEDFKSLYSCPADVSIEVCDSEIKRGGVSYTYYTVCQIKADYSIKERLGLIMGDDLVHKLSSWYRFPELAEEVEYLICRRESKPCWEELPQNIVFKKIETDSLAPQSSTEIRKGSLGLTTLSPRVLKYINDNRLYDYN